MVHSATWYVVMNTTAARVLHDLRDMHDPRHRETAFGEPGGQLRHAQRDCLSMSHASADGDMASAAGTASDTMQKGARAFLHDIFDHLVARRHAGAFDSLVLIGSPGIVELWRQEVPGGVSACVRRDIICNLLGNPQKNLAPAIRALLGPA
ncbi:host attachment protein [Poseidonocella sp. HB161398]|uniref:baeRF12 domain-containing protein n=1 Tax=Poseidonocella sp. HB161398 TaxID=2320855 RepID=UPI001107EEBA|nr:host attachment protein [Poseidonocella sp. HB161398]